MKPLEDMLVLDFSQFLAGPYAAMRLADLGAKVLKIERPDGGDVYRSMYISNERVDEDHLLYHAVNRGKESAAFDLKSDEDRRQIETLIKKADMMLLNFRPGVAERLEIDYDTVKALNPSIVYGNITGYGSTGPWVERPGQDLLVQAVSGIAYLNGDQDQLPIPMGVGIADIVAGEHLVQGMLAGMVQRGVTGKGCHVEVSLLESILDIQFEGLTAYLNDGNQLPVRSKFHNANPYISAPYGIYQTKNGYIALAMCPIPKLGELLSCEALCAYQDSAEWSTKRDEIKVVLAEHLRHQTTEYWLGILEAADVWCANVFDWETLMQEDGFKCLNMLQTVMTSSGATIETLRCPIRIDGEIYYNPKAAPRVNEHDDAWLQTLLS